MTKTEGVSVYLLDTISLIIIKLPQKNILKETLIYNNFLKIKLMYPLIVMTKSNSFSANFKLVDTVPLYRPIINEMNIDSKIIYE